MGVGTLKHRTRIKMKSAPAPNVPGDTPGERFDNAFRKIMTVPKEAFLKEAARLKKLRERKRAKKR
jgi:hypothetical protein